MAILILVLIDGGGDDASGGDVFGFIMTVLMLMVMMA